MIDRAAKSPGSWSRRGALLGGTAGASMLMLAWARQAHGAEARVGGPVHIFGAPRRLPDVDHQVIYRKEDEFVSHPYVMGFWNMGDGELLQFANASKTSYSSVETIAHDQLGREGGSKMVALRSKDWGRTWDGARPGVNLTANIDKRMADARTMGDLQPVDYLNPDVLVSNSSSGGFGRAGSKPLYRVSKDRGHSWSPAIIGPTDSLVGPAGMNSVLVRNDGTVLTFQMDVNEEGRDRHPCVFALPPGFVDFHFVTFITQKVDPYGNADGDYSAVGSKQLFAGHRWFYPRGYMLPDGRILCSIRCQRDPFGDMWTEVYISEDHGRTWEFLSRVNDFGAPGSLVVKRDGRLVMVYGYRLMPSGIRAKVSEDGGRTWGTELIIRDDGGSPDVGYPNAWELDDGRIGTIYYFNSKDDPVQVNGGVRHIQRSIFSID